MINRQNFSVRQNSTIQNNNELNSGADLTKLYKSLKLCLPLSSRSLDLGKSNLGARYKQFGVYKPDPWIYLLAYQLLSVVR